mgnify:FL=1
MFDRYDTGVLEKVQVAFDIQENGGSLLQVIIVVGFMFTAPLFGYLGDCYTRKWLLVGGISVWSPVTLAGSFVPKPVSTPLRWFWSITVIL